MQNKYPNHLVLRAMRITHGETQIECANRLGVTVRTISNWETTHPEALNERKMKRVYKDYKVTPQAAQQRTAEYLDDIRKQGRPHPEDREFAPSAAAQTGKQRMTNFARCRSEYPNTIIGFGPKGGAVTLHGALDALCRDQKPLKEYHYRHLLRLLERRKPVDDTGESLI